MLITIFIVIFTDVPANEQRLIYGGKQVCCGKSLSELYIKEGSLLHMGLRLPISDKMHRMFRPYFIKRLVM